MTDRKGLEFKAKEKILMFKRAGGPEDLRCEECGLRPKGNQFEYDHSVEIWELASELREKFLKEGVPAEYGKLLCVSCHDEKSGRKTGERAHCNRIMKKQAKATESDHPMPCGKKSPYKKRMDGVVVWRETGEPVR